MISLRLIPFTRKPCWSGSDYRAAGPEVESEYAGQGDLDFLDGQAKTRYPLSTLHRLLLTRSLLFVSGALTEWKAGVWSCCKANWCIIFAAGTAADGLSSNPLISEWWNMQAMRVLRPCLPVWLIQPSLWLFPDWWDHCYWCVNVPEIVAHIGENGFAIVPVMDKRHSVTSFIAALVCVMLS